MYAESGSGQPQFSDKPLITSQQPPANGFEPSHAQQRPTDNPPSRLTSHTYRARRTSTRKPAASVSSSDDSLLNNELVQQVLASGAVLPVIAAVLLLLNHHDTLFGWLRAVGFTDTIAILCLGASAYLIGPSLYAKLSSAITPAATPTIRLNELAENVAKLASAVQYVQQNPEPKRWLDMYYNLASDVDHLLQETVQLRKTMQRIQDRGPPEPVKEKGGWKRLSSFSQADKGK